jgi:hypothetical protein
VSPQPITNCLESCLSKADFVPFTYSLNTLRIHYAHHTRCLARSQRFELREPENH